MIKNPFSGKFFVFEGPDGSGQTTQTDLLYLHLRAQGFDVIRTKQPTENSEAGRRIRRILTGQEDPIPPLEFQKLYIEDRKKLSGNLIWPALANGRMIVCDRDAYSTLAYGGIDYDMRQLLELHDKFILADAVFILRVRPEVCMARIERREERPEFFEEWDKLAKVMSNYEKIAGMFDNTHLINGELSIRRVFARVVEIVDEILG